MTFNLHKEEIKQALATQLFLAQAKQHRTNALTI
jgi:hypothetical protein